MTTKLISAKTSSMCLLLGEDGMRKLYKGIAEHEKEIPLFKFRGGGVQVVASLDLMMGNL